MHIETSNSEMGGKLTMNLIRQQAGLQHKDKIEIISHEIGNCLASIETANDMLSSQDLSIEEKSLLQTLRQQATRELAELVKGVVPNIATSAPHAQDNLTPPAW